VSLSKVWNKTEEILILSFYNIPSFLFKYPGAAGLIQRRSGFSSSQPPRIFESAFCLAEISSKLCMIDFLQKR